MSNMCPNTSISEWKTLEKRFGADLAYKLYWLNNNDIPSLTKANELLGKTPNKDQFILEGKVYPLSYRKEIFDALEVLYLNAFYTTTGNDFDSMFLSSIDNTKFEEIKNTAINQLLGIMKKSADSGNTTAAELIIKLNGQRDYLMRVLTQNLAKYHIEVTERVKRRKNYIVDEETGEVGEDTSFINADDAVSEDNKISRSIETVESSLHYNTKSGFPKSVKLLLASIANKDINDKLILSKGLGLPSRNVGLENYLLNKLADIPWNITDQLNKLNELAVNKPNLKLLINKLGGLSKDFNVEGKPYSQLKIRQEFSQAFGKHKYELLVTQLKHNGDIVISNSNQASLQKQIRERWKANYLNNLSKYKTQDEFIEALKNSKDIPAMLGMDFTNINILNEDTLEGSTIFGAGAGTTARNAINRIRDKIQQSYYEAINNGRTIDLKKIYEASLKDSPVSSYMNELIEYASSYEQPVDLQIRNGEGKNIFSINLHTYQSLVSTYLNEASNLPREQREAYINEHIPFVMNVYTQNSKWLEHVKNAGKVNLVLLDALTSDVTGDKLHLSDVKPTDLYSIIINSVMNEFYPAIKHSDRGMFPAYHVNMREWNHKVADNLKVINNKGIWSGFAVAKFKDTLVDYLFDEYSRAKLNNFSIDQYNKSKNLSFILEKINWANYNFTDKSQILKEFSYDLDKFIDSYLNRTLNEAKKLGVLNTGKIRRRKALEENKYNRVIGISNSLLQAFKEKEYAGNSDEVAAENIIGLAAIKFFIGAQEQFKLFLGDPALYKISGTIFDVAKRSNMQSSSKNTTAVDSETNTAVSNMNLESPIFFSDGTVQIYKEGEANGTFTEIVMSDDNFVTAMDVFMKDLYKDQPSKYESYKKFTENDGISLVNPFFMREFQHRRGDYTSAKERNFNIQLRIINNVFSETDPEKREKALEEILQIPQEVLDKYHRGTTDPHDYKYEQLFIEEYGSFVVEKPQYLGINYGMPLEEYKSLDPKKRLNIVAGRKTSYLNLLPTVVMDTILEDVLMFMLKNNIDTIHFNSAAKFGGKHNSQGTFRKFYKTTTNSKGELVTDGFNNDKLDPVEVGYLDFKFLGKQQEIHEEVKDKTTVSTQDRKNKLFGLINDGVPIDYKEGKEAWEKLTKEEKEKASPIQKDVNDYIKAQNKIIESRLYDLKESLKYSEQGGLQNAVEFINILIEQAKDRNSPDVVIESLENWLNEDGTLKFIETLPNYKSIQFILNSLLTNRVMKEKRSGTAVPQLPSTGFEKRGTQRRIINGKIESQDGLGDDAAVKYYTVNDGVVSPAEIIMPLPHYWIEKLFRKYNDVLPGDMYELLRRVNQDIADGKLDAEVTFKALRIPHQQVSSSDVVKVKKFLHPFFQSGVIVSSELVVKTGGDFDIDKLNIYFPAQGRDFKAVSYNKDINVLISKMDESKGKSDRDLQYKKLENFILDVEKRLLLNYQSERFLSPISDEPLQEIRKDKNLVPDKDVPRSHMFELNTLVDQTLTFLGGKGGVGIIATWITFSAIAQVHNLKVNNNYKLHFAGLEDNFNLGNIKSEDFYIDDILSALLTSQVDLVKDPYARDLMLNTQTLNLICYLTLRGVPIKEIVRFLKSPDILYYLEEQNKNESQLFKSTNNRIKKDDLQKKVMERYPTNNYNLKNFLQYIEESKGIADFKKYISADTKFHKDLNSIDIVNELRDVLKASNLIDFNSVIDLEQNSILAEFFNARNHYLLLYNDLYLSRKRGVKYKLDAIKKALSIGEKEDVKNKIMNIVDEEFVNFLIQTNHPDFKNSFKNLAKHANNLVSRLMDFKKTNHNNYFIDQLIPLLPVNEDDYPKLMLFRNKMTTPEINELSAFYSQLKQSNPQLYKDIVIYNTFINGISPSPYQLSKIFPYDAQKDIFSVLNNINISNISNDLLKRFISNLMLSRVDVISTRPFFKTLMVDGVKVYYPYSKIKDGNITKIKILNSSENDDLKDITPQKDYNNTEVADNIEPLVSDYINTILSSAVVIPPTSDSKIDDLSGNNTSVIEQPINKEIKPNEVKGIEINSYQTGLGNSLTNVHYAKNGKSTFDIVPSDKSLKLTKEAKNKWGESVEAWYKSNNAQSKGIPEGVEGDKFDMDLMVGLITDKLTQYPNLVEQINQNGGLAFLQKSTHNMGSGRWSSKNSKNMFMNSLIQAYKNTNQPTEIKPNEIYNQLGNKTVTGNVVIKSVYQQEGIQYAKSIGGVFSLRVNNSNKHFGNPFSSVKSEIDKGLIATTSTKESVKKYIDWVINSQEERAVWIREQLKSGELKGKPIVYYKELGEPSHATALDYLINKYDWNNQSKPQITLSNEQPIIKKSEKDVEMGGIEPCPF